MKTITFEKKTGKLFSVIGNPFRVKLLMTIGEGEACVCHLEALLGKRQAFISQHLMALRKEGLLETRREGKYIYYRLSDLDTLLLIQTAGKMIGAKEISSIGSEGSEIVPACPCPKCAKENVVRVNEIRKLEATNT
jgi:ArsR family transcriptional regulator